MNLPEIIVSREEIKILKSQLRRAGAGVYSKITRLTHDAAVAPVLCSNRETKRLLQISRFLGWLYPFCFLALAPAYFFIKPWWAGLGLIVFLILGLNSVHTEINLELGARFLILNRKSKVFDESANLPGQTR